ncbi:MAG TPA: maltose alpha-D-glucosyltransferase, partial [Stellaceae bacterium]|nr:maltose alpha-D-glucosyltransferase [Stellaceae bacterium]
MVVSPASDPAWYKDAIIYQLHIKAFADGNDDGIGDFPGLISKLDYIESLGVTAIWLLPFYPSPLRDDGYDIADYRNVHPSYGTLGDFRTFVKEAHRRGLRIISELVVNHTSDQHPWFQRARLAKRGSRYRDFYVWSDTNQKYAGTRVIFCDTETSNWTWDPVAGQYYWHRFYSHQPDLNFDNPAVVRAVLNAMRFWLDLGVDGLRLDAVPYLCEREGTINENLPETHVILRRLRAEIDARYQGRMLLAEANQWPEDVLPYFGDGDECHMAFHFPLMPRIYMAVAQEDRHPITDILRQTPDLPDNCQWAIFLRNHDELTLEMVTDRERDYLWGYYANDARMRINLGIRRRLAPLMDNDRTKIDLLNSLLLSLPGTPVLYYGDEIGMGDNVYLGDRDGVRTPMQWSVDRNGGFSRADPARLYLPAVQDPVYGYLALNVEAQNRLGSSLLNATRRLLGVRRGFRAFGRGTLSFLYPSNRKVLAYLRRFEDELILCVVNLARTAQPVELDLSSCRGRIPVELIGRTMFPAITERPYTLTLQGHHFFWFALIEPGRIDGFADGSRPETEPDYLTLVTPNGWSDLLRGREAATFLDSVVPRFLPMQRWYGAKDRKLKAVMLAGAAQLEAESGEGGSGFLLLVTEVSYARGHPERYA